MQDGMATVASNPAQGVLHPTYRVVQDQEMLTLTPLFKQLNWPLPDPAYAKVIVAEIGEGADTLICGFAVVQFVAHAEPLWIHPKMRGTGIADGLVEHVVHYIEEDCGLKRYVCTAREGSLAAKLAEKYGMRKYDGHVVYVKG